MHAHVLVDAAGDVLHAVHLADRVGIVERHRRRGAETGLEIAQPLARGRMVVLLHRIVFRMKGGLEHVVAEPIERVFQRFARIALVGDGFVAVGDFRPPVAGANRNLVEAGRAHLLLDRSLGAGADRHHRQHGGHADGDAEHRQAGLQPVAAKRLDRHVDHGMTKQALHFAIYPSERSAAAADCESNGSAIGNNQSVPEIDRASAICRDITLMRDHDDRDAALAHRGSAKISITS